MTVQIRRPQQIVPQQTHQLIAVPAQNTIPDAIQIRVSDEKKIRNEHF